MILTFKDAAPTDIVNMSSVTPDLLTQDLEAVRKTTVGVGAQTSALGDLFDVAESDADRLLIRNADQRLSHVGAALRDGEIVVEGDCGDYAAHAMSGGVLRVTGNVGDCAAARMTGGRAVIDGNAGDALAAAPVGAVCGINNGAVVVGGSVGDRACERMRRGTVVILGDCGDYCAARMIAGTVFILGKPGRRLGYEMRRGTLVIKDRAFMNNPFFVRSGAQISFMPLLARYVRSLDKSTQAVPESCSARYTGDVSVDGLGEIIVL